MANKSDKNPRGAGRHKKDCTCEKCIEKDFQDLEKQDEKENKESEIPVEQVEDLGGKITEGEFPAEQKPAEEIPAEQKPAEEIPAEQKPAEEKPVEQKPADANSLHIDFSEYVKSHEAKKENENAEPAEQQQQPPAEFHEDIKRGRGRPRKDGSRAPVSKTPDRPSIVVINGMMLMAMINFVTPPLFAWVGNFASGGFQSADFKLPEESMRPLYPAADIIAKDLFKNMPPIVQLIFGYGIMSFSNAFKMKALREKGVIK